MFPFTAATFNLCGGADRWLARRHLFVGQIVDRQPDIVALQEVNLSFGQGKWLVRQVNIRLTGDSRHPYRLVLARNAGRRPHFSGVGIMTRLPIIYHDALPLGYSRQVALRANVELPAGAADTRRQSLDFVTVQLLPGAAGQEARLAQAMNLVGWINEKRRVPLQIICGDLNEPPTGAAVSLMRQSYRSAYACVHKRDPIATYPTSFLLSRPVTAECLDYVFISPAVYRVMGASFFCDKPAAEDETLYPSDHVGLLVTLEV
jgi:endonuclease/exonuclease/phosphatase family metal-dependent hydrolase